METSAQSSPGGQQQASDLAKQLSNPIASLISVPFQYNNNQGLGTSDGMQNYINVQPVILFSINENWNVISRMVMPFVSLSGLTPTFGTQEGMANTVQSFFSRPRHQRKTV